MTRPGMPIGHWGVITELPESDIWSHLFNFMKNGGDSHWHFYYTHTFWTQFIDEKWERQQGENRMLKTDKGRRKRVMMDKLHQRPPGIHLWLNKVNGSLQRRKMHTTGRGVTKDISARWCQKGWELVLFDFGEVSRNQVFVLNCMLSGSGINIIGQLVSLL